MVKQQWIEFCQWIKRHAKVITFSIFCIFALLTVITILFPGKTYSQVTLESHISQNVGPFIDGKSVEYEFSCEEDGLSGVQILFSTYARVNAGGKIHVEITDLQTNKVAYQGIIKTEQLQDNQYYPVMFPEIPDSKGNQYNIKLYPENCDLSNAVTFWIGDSGQDSEIMVDGEMVTGGLISDLLISKDRYRLLWELLLLTAGSFALWGVAPKKYPEISEEIGEGRE